MSIVAIIVSYNPQPEKLTQLIDGIRNQVGKICLVDNSPTALDLSTQNKLDHYQHLEDNPGIATAQNHGIAYAVNIQADYVLLLDQDSLPAPNMVSALLAGFNTSTAAIGPMFIDIKSGEHSSFLSLGYLKNTIKTVENQNPNEFIETDALISSGMLISTKALKDIGLMDESLFIDHVDTEWCIRAKHLGYRLQALTGDWMQHDLGIGVKKIGFGRPRHVAVHTPYRYYYIFRNGLLLFKRSSNNLKWKLFHLKRIAVLMVFIVSTGTAKQNIYYALRGLFDGLRGKTGKLLR